MVEVDEGELVALKHIQTDVTECLLALICLVKLAFAEEFTDFPNFTHA